jgi:hypothetical protein
MIAWMMSSKRYYVDLCIDHQFVTHTEARVCFALASCLQLIEVIVIGKDKLNRFVGGNKPKAHKIISEEPGIYLKIRVLQL